jgi:hypothetical protein
MKRTAAIKKMSDAELHREVLAVKVRHAKSSKQEIRARLACAKLEKAMLVAKERHDFSTLREQNDKWLVTAIEKTVSFRQEQACSVQASGGPIQESPGTHDSAGAGK